MKQEGKGKPNKVQIFRNHPITPEAVIALSGGIAQWQVFPRFQRYSYYGIAFPNGNYQIFRVGKSRDGNTQGDYFKPEQRMFSYEGDYLVAVHIWDSTEEAYEEYLKEWNRRNEGLYYSIDRMEFYEDDYYQRMGLEPNRYANNTGHPNFWIRDFAVDEDCIQMRTELRINSAQETRTRDTFGLGKFFGAAMDALFSGAVFHAILSLFFDRK